MQARPVDEFTRIFIIGDNRLFTEAVAAMLNTKEGITLVGSTADQFEALETVRSMPIDVVLVDVNMGDAHVVLLTRDIKAEAPELKVIILGLDNSDESILGYIEAGADGYILKDGSFNELVSTIREVRLGGTSCSPRVAALVFARVTELTRDRRGRQILRRTPLTRREQDILKLIAAGLANKEIAERLNISVSTVKNHVHNILDKFQVHYRHEAIRYAYDIGLLDRPYCFR
jgi:DNA-binding NarL/FixJ family response regulator